MAEDYPVGRATQTRVDAPPAPRPRPRRPDDPDVARAEIEATRARMSETIDEIEDVLMRKKDEITEKLDVLAPVRKRPLQTLGVIFGAGLALGLLTGGDGKSNHRQADVEGDDELEDEDDEAAEAWERAETWEDRAHRLLRIARAQEAELEIHRKRGPALLSRSRDHAEIEEDDEDDYEDDGGGFFDRIRDAAAERLSGIVSETMQRIMRGV